eukprot:scaffold7210_cov32-Tisochrysis_lutea.AAC.5
MLEVAVINIAAVACAHFFEERVDLYREGGKRRCSGLPSVAACDTVALAALQGVGWGRGSQRFARIRDPIERRSARRTW